jgi:hypothetical protein
MRWYNLFSSWQSSSNPDTGRRGRSGVQSVAHGSYTQRLSLLWVTWNRVWAKGVCFLLCRLKDILLIGNLGDDSAPLGTADLEQTCSFVPMLRSLPPTPEDIPEENGVYRLSRCSIIDYAQTRMEYLRLTLMPSVGVLYHLGWTD